MLNQDVGVTDATCDPFALLCFPVPPSLPPPSMSSFLPSSHALLPFPTGFTGAKCICLIRSVLSGDLDFELCLTAHWSEPEATHGSTLSATLGATLSRGWVHKAQ